MFTTSKLRLGGSRAQGKRMEDLNTRYLIEAGIYSKGKRVRFVYNEFGTISQFSIGRVLDGPTIADLLITGRAGLRFEVLGRVYPLSEFGVRHYVTSIDKQVGVRISRWQASWEAKYGTKYFTD